MHYLKFRSLARVLFLSSIVLTAAFAAFSTTVVLVAILWHTGDHSWITPVAVSGGICLFLGFSQAILSGRTACQLCQMPILREFGCSKNTNAKFLLGSYRLRVAGSIILQGKFHCPYCGERFNIWAKPREKPSIQAGNQGTRKAGKLLPSKK